MDQQKIEKTVRYFENQICQCKGRVQLLTLDDRRDEAVFAKIETNVYEIFNSVLSAAVRTTEGDDQALVQFFLTRIQQIPLNWQAALENAKKHGEMEKAYIEQLKLDVVVAIKGEFERIWEVNT